MRKIKGLRWYMIALVTLGTVLGYLTRNTVAAAAPTLMEELHISTQQYSYIIAAYSAAYTVMQPVAGYVLDILGTMGTSESWLWLRLLDWCFLNISECWLCWRFLCWGSFYCWCVILELTSCKCCCNFFFSR